VVPEFPVGTRDKKNQTHHHPGRNPQLANTIFQLPSSPINNKQTHTEKNKTKKLL
jgi:hypothetical protein